MRIPLAAGLLIILATSCRTQLEPPSELITVQPSRIVDLGAVMNEDTAYRFWGEQQLRASGLDRLNVFEDREVAEPVYVVNSWYTLANHGGPHVDAPNHVGTPDGKGIDDFAVESFVGPAKIINVSHLPQGDLVPVSLVESGGVQPGDIVLLYTGYVTPPADEFPVYTTLSEEAARYLASLPVKAIGTDALSTDQRENRGGGGATDYRSLAPIHHAFLTRDILIYEQLANLDELLGSEQLQFVGVPLNVEDGNGVPVRPVVFVFDKNDV